MPKLVDNKLWDVVLKSVVGLLASGLVFLASYNVVIYFGLTELKGNISRLESATEKLSTSKADIKYVDEKQDNVQSSILSLKEVMDEDIKEAKLFREEMSKNINLINVRQSIIIENDQGLSKKMKQFMEFYNINSSDIIKNKIDTNMAVIDTVYKEQGGGFNIWKLPQYKNIFALMFNDTIYY